MIGAIMKTVDHIAIRVKNIDKCREWWEDNCGARCVFSTDSYHRLQLFNTTIALIDETTYEHNHVGILVNYKENLPKDGVIVKHRDETVGSYVRDPEGNVVEFIYYSPGAKKKIGLKNEQSSEKGPRRTFSKSIQHWGLHFMEVLLRL